MNKEWHQKLIETYRAFPKTIEDVNEIFTQGDIRYADLDYEVIVAGFIDNGAISIGKRKVNIEPTAGEEFKGPQKDLKFAASEVLRMTGFRISGVEKAFAGGIADILARNTKGESIAVECGPCNIRKAVDYLEVEGNRLWIITRDGNLSEVKRGAKWDSFFKFYQGIQNFYNKEAIEKTFAVKKMANPGVSFGRRKIPRVLEPHEIAEMLRISGGNSRDTMLMKFMFFMGLTSGEIQNLIISDIDINKGFVRIAGGENKERSIPLPNGFSMELMEYIGARNDGLLIQGRGKCRKISDRHIRRIVKSYAKAANVRKYEEIHPHTLRHSYATHLQNSGVPLNIIQNLLGHERIETTTIYTHTGVEHTKE